MVCVDLSPITIRGLLPLLLNFRRIKLPKSKKSLCFPIEVLHLIFRKIGFLWRGPRTLTTSLRTETYQSKSVVDIECILASVRHCSTARILLTLSQCLMSLSLQSRAMFVPQCQRRDLLL